MSHLKILQNSRQTAALRLKLPQNTAHLLSLRQACEAGGFHGLLLQNLSEAWRGNMAQHVQHSTVDGRNPAPAGMYKTL